MQPHGDGVYRNLHRLVHPHGRGLRHASDQRRIQRRPDPRSGYGIDLSRRHRATHGSQFHLDVCRLLSHRNHAGACDDVYRDRQRYRPRRTDHPDRHGQLLKQRRGEAQQRRSMHSERQSRVGGLCGVVHPRPVAIGHPDADRALRRRLRPHRQQRQHHRISGGGHDRERRRDPGHGADQHPAPHAARGRGLRPVVLHLRAAQGRRHDPGRFHGRCDQRHGDAGDRGRLPRGARSAASDPDRDLQCGDLHDRAADGTAAGEAQPPQGDRHAADQSPADHAGRDHGEQPLSRQGRSGPRDRTRAQRPREGLLPRDRGSQRDDRPQRPMDGRGPM